MNSFIKRNQKKILAIFSAGLMVSFGLTGYISDRTRSDVTVGYAGRTKITGKELANSRTEWELLKNTLYLVDTDPNTGQSRKVAFLPSYFGRTFNPQEAEG